VFAQAVAGVALATRNIADLTHDAPDGENGFESFFADAGEILAPPELQQLFGK